MKIITLINQKYETGKTTTAVNLGHTLFLKKYNASWLKKYT